MACLRFEILYFQLSRHVRWPLGSQRVWNGIKLCDCHTYNSKFQMFFYQTFHPK